VSDSLHNLLKRQLRRAGANVEAVPDLDAWHQLLDNVSLAYRSSDEDRLMIERSLELTSAEMKTLYDRIAAERDRLERELEIARVLQTALLPKQTATHGFEIHGKMVPATEVGGDYYDVIPVDGACWVGIGDVAGHGLRAAIVMLMVQSMIATLARARPEAPPSEILRATNAALWDGTRERLQVKDHVTCTLFRCGIDGRVRYAGAHEPTLIVRATGECERIAADGTWLSVVRDLGDKNPDRDFELGYGDTMVLYTDGAIEARNAANEELGLERFRGVLDGAHACSVTEIAESLLRVVQAWQTVQRDDITLLVVRYLGQ
jgi:phosphoserine phosphatase RsbU/P